MPSHPQLEVPAKLRQRVEHFFDVVARLLAKRWLREQQDDPGQGDNGGSNPEPPKS